ncbi:MAG: LysR family transcriptional regulator [Sporomusaceae bacterium]|nr:LysR family transcriptional regulator [Sporomusaceae bacterium]
MEDRDWLIIKELHQQKNISKTAQALYISQPSLTARIRRIEEEFGVKLIYRGSRGIHFTPEGDYLAQCARTMLTTIGCIKEQVVNMSSEVKGTVRLAAPNYLARFKLPKLLRLFKERYPQVEFDVTNAWSRDICKLLYNQDIHVGFVRSDYGWSGEKQLLHQEPLCIAAKEQISFADLPKLPRIDYQTDAAYKNFLDNWWNENFSQPPKISMTVSQLDICKAMVVNGLGYGILPSTVFAADEPVFQLAMKTKGGETILRNTWMLYQQEILELKTVRLFIEFAKAVDFCRLS